MPSSPMPRGTIFARARSKMRSFASRYASKRAVTVEVVGLEVEEHRDVARELVHVLELEARELADDRRAGLDLARRRPVSARPTFPATSTRRPAAREDRAEQLGRRRLPVRARDADQRVAGEQPVAELDLAPDRDAARTRSRGERRRSRHARALDDELDTLEQRLLLRSETNFDAGRRRACPRRRPASGRPRRPRRRAARARVRPPGRSGRARARAPAAAATPRARPSAGTCPAHDPCLPPGGA